MMGHKKYEFLYCDRKNSERGVRNQLRKKGRNRNDENNSPLACIGPVMVTDIEMFLHVCMLAGRGGGMHRKSSTYNGLPLNF